MEISENSKKKNIEVNVNYVTTKEATKRLGVHVLTLHNWERDGKIDTWRTPGGHRKYNVDKFLKEQEEQQQQKEKPLKKKANTGSVVMEIDTNSTTIDLTPSVNTKKNVCYIRVSCVGNKDVLKSQKTFLQKQYPESQIIEDVGSINNFDKQGLKNLISMINNKTVDNVIVANKSNLSKFSIDMLNFLLSQNGGGKVITENYNESEDVTKDLIEDVLQIINTCTTELTELKNKANKK